MSSTQEHMHESSLAINADLCIRCRLQKERETAKDGERERDGEVGFAQFEVANGKMYTATLHRKQRNARMDEEV